MKNYVYRIFQAFFVVCLVAILVFGAKFVLPKVRHARGLANRKEEILTRIEQKKAEIQDLKSRQNRFNTDREFVKTLARQRRRVFPGELVFQFDD